MRALGVGEMRFSGARVQGLGLGSGFRRRNPEGWGFGKGTRARINFGDGRAPGLAPRRGGRRGRRPCRRDGARRLGQLTARRRRGGAPRGGPRRRSRGGGAGARVGRCGGGGAPALGRPGLGLPRHPLRLFPQNRARVGRRARLRGAARRARLRRERGERGRRRGGQWGVSLRWQNTWRLGWQVPGGDRDEGKANSGGGKFWKAIQPRSGQQSKPAQMR
jgi:hypothetical protein